MEPLHQAFDELDAQVASLSERITNSREQYENLQPVDENRLSEILRRMEVLRMEMSQAATTEAVAAIKDELAALKEETSTMSDLCKAQSDQLRMMVGDAENWAQEIRSVNQGLIELNKQMDEAEALAEQLAAELKAKQTELLSYVDAADEKLKDVERALAACQKEVEAFQAKQDLLEEKIDATNNIINEIQELLKSPVFDDELRKDITKRTQEIINRFTNQLGQVSTISMDSYNALEKSILGDIEKLRSQLQQLREQIAAAKLVDDLQAVQDALVETGKGVNELQEKGDQTFASIMDHIQSYPFDDMNASITSIQNELEKLKSEGEAIIAAVGRIVVDGKVVTACRDAAGRPASLRQKGLVILQFADGTTKKVYNR